MLLFTFRFFFSQLVLIFRGFSLFLSFFSLVLCIMDLKQEPSGLYIKNSLGDWQYKSYDSTSTVGKETSHGTGYLPRGTLPGYLPAQDCLRYRSPGAMSLLRGNFIDSSLDVFNHGN